MAEWAEPVSFVTLISAFLLPFRAYKFQMIRYPFISLLKRQTLWVKRTGKLLCFLYRCLLGQFDFGMGMANIRD